jgi:hypothetical protein
VRLAAKLGGPTSPPLRTRWTWQLTSGNRYTRPRGGVFYVNPNESDMFGGWKAIVHDISHWAGRRLFPKAPPHSPGTAFIERKLAEHVINSGWLDDKLKREPKAKPEIDVKALRHQRTLAAIKRWESKAKRAKTTLAKLHQRRKRYEQTLAAQ